MPEQSLTTVLIPPLSSTKRLLVGAFALSSSVLVCAPAHAAAIGLCNTGWAANCAGIQTMVPGPTYTDPNYQLVVNPNGSGPANATLVNPFAPYPIPSPWLPDTNVSHWIGPAKDQQVGSGCCAPGDYVYRDAFAFDATGSATLSGRWAADFEATMTLDGTGPILAFNNTFAPWTAFSFAISGAPGSSHFLEFRVTNLSEATGLRVEYNGQPVPEPGSLALAGISLLGLGAMQGRSRWPSASAST